MGKPVWTVRLVNILFLATGGMFALSPPMMAQTSDTPCASSGHSSMQACENTTTGPAASSRESQSETTTSAGSNQNDWVHRWMRTVDKARASQPRFVAPIVTTHVMLVEQYRYDMAWQQDPVGGTITSNYGASRGLEIIPTTRLEVAVFPPPYLVHQSSMPDGFGDFSFQVKYRAFSAPEGQGDYFVGFFFGGSFPTGTPPNGLGHTILIPTFAAAKGIGPWDIQSTIGASLPATDANLLGRAIVFNTAVDYRIKGKIWPMLEQNSTFWSGGTLDGRKQVFLTPGIVLGGFPLAERLHLSFGTGVQIAVTQFNQLQPPLDRFDTLPVLRLRAGTVQGVSTPIRCSLRRPRVHLEMRVASKSLDRDKRAAKRSALRRSAPRSSRQCQPSRPLRRGIDTTSRRQC